MDIRIVNVVSGVVLLCVALIVVYYGIKAIKKDKITILHALRNMNKTSFIGVYLLITVMYWTAHIYNGQPVGGAFLMAIKSCIDSIALKFDYSSVAKIYSVSTFYRVTLDICLFLAAANVILILLMLFGLSIVNGFQKSLVLWKKCRVYVIVGDDSHNAMVLDSICADNARKLAQAKRISKERKAEINKTFGNKIAACIRELRESEEVLQEGGQKVSVQANRLEKLKFLRRKIAELRAERADLLKPKKARILFLTTEDTSKNPKLDDLLSRGAAYIKIKESDDIAKIIDNLFGTEKLYRYWLRKSYTVRDVNVIINTSDDRRDLVYVKQLSELINDKKLVDYVTDKHFGLNVYVYGNPENESVFMNQVDKTTGCVQYINEYKLLANEFIKNYPLTEYMTSEHLDTEKGLLRNNVDVNVIMIGFGKINRTLLPSMISVNQFLTLSEDGRVVPKNVNYHILDRRNADADKNLNHTYFRYVSEFLSKIKPEDRNNCTKCDKLSAVNCKVCDKEYLDVVDAPANVYRYSLDMADFEYNLLLKEILKNGAEKKIIQKQNGQVTITSTATDNIQYNYVIVSLGEDMDDIDMAQKLYERVVEWRAESTTHIFAKVFDDSLGEAIRSLSQTGKIGYVCFGGARSIVYNVPGYIDGSSERMAMDFAGAYSTKEIMRKYAGNGNLSGLSEALIKEWYDMPRVKRESNIAVANSLRFKLHLAGYDVAPLGENDVSEKLGKSEEFYKNMAVQEHQRWNAYMITCGFVLNTIKNIRETLYENEVPYRVELNDKNTEIVMNTGKAKSEKKLTFGKSYAYRLHGNITSQRGLEAYEAMTDQKIIGHDGEFFKNLATRLSASNLRLVKRVNDMEPLEQCSETTPNGDCQKKGEIQ